MSSHIYCYKVHSSIPEFVLDNLDSLLILRNVIKLSKTRVARLLGVLPETYLGYEQGYYIPPKHIYNRLAELFDWEVWE